MEPTKSPNADTSKPCTQLGAAHCRTCSYYFRATEQNGRRKYAEYCTYARTKSKDPSKSRRVALANIKQCAPMRYMPRNGSLEQQMQENTISFTLHILIFVVYEAAFKAVRDVERARTIYRQEVKLAANRLQKLLKEKDAQLLRTINYDEEMRDANDDVVNIFWKETAPHRERLYSAMMEELADTPLEANEREAIWSLFLSSTISTLPTNIVNGYRIQTHTEECEAVLRATSKRMEELDNLRIHLFRAVYAKLRILRGWECRGSEAKALLREAGKFCATILKDEGLFEKVGVALNRLNELSTEKLGTHEERKNERRANAIAEAKERGLITAARAESLFEVAAPSPTAKRTQINTTALLRHVQTNNPLINKEKWQTLEI